MIETEGKAMTIKKTDNICIENLEEGRKEKITPVVFINSRSVPFVPAKGKRHGRVWMEYNGKVEN